MSTVKITDLPAISTINANTANTVLVGVDIPTNVTGKITLTTLAAGLYSNNNLVVGNNYTVLPNVVGQFTGNSATYLQVNLENQTPAGSGDYVITADDGTDTNYFLDLGFNGSTFSDPTYSSTKAHDGYLYVSSTGTNKGNLSIGTTNSTGKVNFVVGGMETANIVGYVDVNGIWSPSINSVVSANAASANSVINTRVSANVATLRGEISGNVSTLNGSITSNITTQNTFTQAAFNKANNALANTTGILDGKLTITSGLDTNGIVTISNSSFGATQALVTLSSSNTGYSQPPGGDGYVLHITGKHNTPTRVISDSYGANGQLVFPIFGGRAARGNVTNPSAVQTNDVLTRIGASGYGTSGWQAGGTSRIDFVAGENFTDFARGTIIKFYNIVNGTNTLQEIASFNANTIHFTGTVIPEKGFAYTPNNITSNATSYTIDFVRDSMMRLSCNDNMSIALTNYQTGKIVEVWVTNNANQNKTVTHGCLANNSTAKATAFTVLANSCAFLKYFSIDGDNANTFVSITA